MAGKSTMKMTDKRPTNLRRNYSECIERKMGMMA
jgi:hypothetical protein